MFARFNHFLSFIVLAGVGGYCLVIYLMQKGLYNETALVLEFPYATFLFITLHGLVGGVIYAQDSSNYTLWKWLYDTEIFLKTISYPCFVTEIWLKYGVIQPEVAWIHAIVGAIPAALFVLDNRLKKSWIDVIVYLSTVSLVIVCFQNSNKWGLVAAGTFTVGYYMHSCFMSFLTSSIIEIIVGNCKIRKNRNLIMYNRHFVRNILGVICFIVVCFTLWMLYYIMLDISLVCFKYMMYSLYNKKILVYLSPPLILRYLSEI